MVDIDNYLLELMRYIHLNPVRAGLVKHPEGYSFSSHRAYCGKEILPWLTTDWVLGQFGKQLKHARQQYVAFVMDVIDLGHQEQFHQGETDVRVLGDDRFLKRVLGRPVRATENLPTFQTVVTTISKAYGLTLPELKAPLRSRLAAEARSLVALVAVQLKIDSLTAVAAYFGRDVATLSTGIRRLTMKISGPGDGYKHCVCILEQFNIKV